MIEICGKNDALEVNMGVFKDYAYYYNAFYQEKDYSGEAKQVDKILKKYGKNVSSIINFGCGTGRHDIELVNLGYRCDGIDVSSDMVAISKENARKKDIKINYYVADVRNYSSGKKYDAVISLFHVMSYQNKNEDIISAFRSARKALDNEGILLFDVWYGPGVLTDKPEVRVKEVQDEKNKLIRIAKPVMHDKTNVVEVYYEILIIDKQTNKVRMISETHNMRYFFRPELEVLLEASGFRLLDNLDCQTLGMSDFASWTSYFIARAV